MLREEPLGRLPLVGLGFVGPVNTGALVPAIGLSVAEGSTLGRLKPTGASESGINGVVLRSPFGCIAQRKL